ncbi:transposase [Qipengyuania citrea]|nr:hypothetical protein [Qipengyuania citrea]
MAHVSPEPASCYSGAVCDRKCRYRRGAHTDELRIYASLSNVGYRHARVNQGATGYACYDYRLAKTVTVNGIENFWRHLKWSINGTHTSVSAKHLNS